MIKQSKFDTNATYVFGEPDTRKSLDRTLPYFKGNKTITLSGKFLKDNGVKQISDLENAPEGLPFKPNKNYWIYVVEPNGTMKYSGDVMTMYKPQGNVHQQYYPIGDDFTDRTSSVHGSDYKAMYQQAQDEIEELRDQNRRLLDARESERESILDTAKELTAQQLEMANNQIEMLAKRLEEKEADNRSMMQNLWDLQGKISGLEATIKANAFSEKLKKDNQIFQEQFKKSYAKEQEKESSSLNDGFQNLLSIAQMVLPMMQGNNGNNAPFQQVPRPIAQQPLADAPRSQPVQQQPEPIQQEDIPDGMIQPANKYPEGYVPPPARVVLPPSRKIVREIANAEVIQNGVAV